MTKVDLANARLEECTKIQVISSTTFVTPQLINADGDDSDSHDAMMRSFSLPTRNSTGGFVRPSFGPAVRPFVCPSVTLELKTRN